MKVLMIRANQGFPDSRVEKEIYSLSKEHEVELLGWDRTQNKKKIERRTVRINNKSFKYHLICIKASQGGGFKKLMFPMFGFWNQMIKFIRKYQSNYDVIHFCDFDTAAMAFSVIDRRKTKIVYDIFDYYADSHSAPKLVSNMIRKRENYIINHSDLVELCSEKRKKQIAPANNKNTIIIHNSPSKVIKMDNVNIQGDKTHSKKRIVYAGMLSNGRYLKEIADCVIKKSDIEWHVGGFGELTEYFEKLSKKYDNIFFYGKMKYSEVLFLEKNCDFMTAIYDPKIPNHKYAAPNKFYEALMLGKPLIMIKGTGMADLVSKYNLGVTMDLKKYNFNMAFEDVLTSVISTKDTTSISNRETRLYTNEFSWDSMEKRLLGAYRCL
ncbi:glycosyltransferase family 4 protein [Limosilactobacillus fermentum]|uniref:glycosyltransferase family 4 protein n=1 Tax=Limosilactobacillus fermentum TaxID=1613 RepID=UPI0011088A50|nr:glycosyltransferase family 4 protein [Limosilactobacillus fermentum]TLQ38365.1 glycosyltransferase family 4 protein [Limosilactobacillus fermentum]